MIVPAFFHLLKYLREQGRKFSIVFRSFGNDLPIITEELNAFCRGDHPLFPDFALNTSDESYELQLDGDFGRFYRHGSAAHETHLILGTMDEDISHKGLDHYRGSHRVISGFGQIHASMRELLRTKRTLALGDNYQWWAVQQERFDSGKLLLVDPEDESEHHIFFDDNLWFDDYETQQRLIVDVRHAVTGEPIDAVRCRGVYLVQAEILRAFADPDYFIKVVQQAEAQRAAEKNTQGQ